MLEIAKNLIAKKFNGYIVIIVVMNFHKNFSIANIFPSWFPGIFANIFQCKIIPVYSIWHSQTQLTIFLYGCQIGTTNALTN